MERLIVGRDGVIRAARLRSGKHQLERAVQHLFPLELSCDKPLKAVDGEIPVVTGPTLLHPDATEFTPRPRRDAAVAARARVQNLLSDEQLDLTS